MHLLFLFYISLLNQTNWSLDCDSLSEPLTQIHQAVYAPNGQMYLLDFPECHIYIISPDGKEIKRFGQKGQGPGEWQWGTKLTYSPQQNCLFLFDGGKDAWIQFQMDGQLVEEDRSIGQSCEFFLEPGIEILSETKNPFETSNYGCDVFLQKEGNKKLLVHFNSEDQPDPLMLNRENIQLQLDLGDRSQSFTVLSPDGAYLAIGSTGKLKIQVFETKSFKQHSIFHGQLASVPLSDEDKKDIADNLNLNVNGSRLNVTIEELQIPDFLPPIEQVSFDQENRIWVRLRPAHKAKKVRYKVYDLDGKLLGNLEEVVGFHFISADSSSIWSYTSSEEEDTLVLQKKDLSL